MNYYEHHLGDYARDTGHLSALEHGVYRLLLDRIYATESGIPDGQQYRVAKATSRAEKTAVDTIVAEFFFIEAGRLWNKRARAEINAYHTKRAKAQRSAIARWHPADADALRSHDGADADALRSHCGLDALQSPIPNLQEEGEIGQSGFDRFWQAYPKKRKRKTAQAIWARKRLEAKTDELIADIRNRRTSDRRWIEGFIPDPTTYLNGERWTDEIDSAPRPSIVV